MLTFVTVKYYPTWLPGAGFKTKLLKSRALLQDMLNIQYNNIRKVLVRHSIVSAYRSLTFSQESGGAQRSSFAANLLEVHIRDGCLSAEDNRDIKGASGTLYAGKGPPILLFPYAYSSFPCTHS